VRRRGVGFIGVGAVAELHRRALEGSRAGRLVAVWGPAPSDRERARAWGVRLHRGPRELVEDPEVEAVFVLSPLETHRELALLALEARKPVLVEKPVAASAAEVLELERRAAELGVACVPGHNYVYDPALQRGRRLIAAGELGRICMTWIVYAIRHSEELAARYPGVLWQIMPHHLYTLLYLVGQPRRVVALSTRPPDRQLDREEQVALQLEMADGSLAQLFASFAADDETSQPWTFMVKTLGTAGGFVHTWRDAVVARSIGTHARAYVSYEESFRNQDEHFLARCLEGDAPLSSLRDAYLVQVVVEAAARSIASGQVVEPAFEDAGVPPYTPRGEGR